MFLFVFLRWFLVFLRFFYVFHWIFVREGFPTIPSKYPLKPPKSFPYEFPLFWPPLSYSLFSLRVLFSFFVKCWDVPLFPWYLCGLLCFCCALFCLLCFVYLRCLLALLCFAFLCFGLLLLSLLPGLCFALLCFACFLACLACLRAKLCNAACAWAFHFLLIQVYMQAKGLVHLCKTDVMFD